jgi:hypothetical protein
MYLLLIHWTFCGNDTVVSLGPQRLHGNVVRAEVDDGGLAAGAPQISVMRNRLVVPASPNGMPAAMVT